MEIWSRGLGAMTGLELVLIVLAVWRVTHLIHAEEGPWRIFERLRGALGTEGMPGRALDCFYCASLWVAAPVAWLAGSDLWGALLLWPAASAGAILVEHTVSRLSGTGSDVPVEWHELPSED